MKKKKITTKKSHRTLAKIKPLKHRNKAKAKVKDTVKRQLKQNRPAHKRFFLSPITVFSWLCSLVFIISWSTQAIGDSYTVTAIVPAPTMQLPATIDSPVNTVSASQEIINITGSCPGNSYVNLYDNGLFAGTALCQNDQYVIATSLYSGTNSFKAQDYNFTNQAGPSTIHSNVTYTTLPTTANLEDSDTTTANAAPLLLTSSFQFQTFVTGTQFSWSVDLEGGFPPYTVNVNWGDGQTSNLVFKTDPVFTITHHYQSAGYFPIKVVSDDTRGDMRLMQLSAIVKTKNSTEIYTAPTTGSSAKLITPVASGFSAFLVKSKAWLWVAWPSITIISLMTIGFWLGEKQEERKLVKKRFVPRHT